MLLNARKETELSPDVAFEKVSNFEGLENFARQRGISVSRMEGVDGALLGTKWFISAPFRGRVRDFELEVISFDPPHRQEVAYSSGGISGVIETKVQPHPEGGSIVEMGITVEAQSLTGRLLLQSLKLARGTLEKQMAKRLQNFIEA